MGCGGSKEPEPEPPPAHMMKRRASAAAQGGIDPNSIKVNLMTLPKVLKSEEAMARIKVCVSKNVLCNHLSDEYKDAVIASMKETTVKSGETIIKQGDLGDFWYVVDSGTLEVNKTLPGESEATKVNSYAVGDSFGELALMFNQRRAASVIATSDCVLWAVDQATFQALVKTAANAHQETITY